MSNAAVARTLLAESLTKRTSTAVVAEAILSLGLPQVSKDSKLHQLLKGLARDAQWQRGAINDDFDRVDSLDDQLATYRILFPQVEQATPVDELVRAGLAALGATQPYVPYVSAEQALMHRAELDWRLGVATSKAAFTKRLRFLKNFEEKVARFNDVTTLRHAQMQAKSRLAYLVDADKCDDLSLAFIAYLASRANRRSLFMLGGQSKSFDQVTDELQKSFTEDSAWDQIALVMPTAQMLAKVSVQRRGELTGIFHREMAVAAGHLGALWPSLPVRMRAEMVMVQGVDSSRWNAYAGALNTMRSAWISAMVASGFEGAFDSYLPGKAPRLMASDLVWWARQMGQNLHEDTRLFGRLPRPWDVIDGSAIMTRAMVLAEAEAEKVDAEKSGWVGPRAAVESEITAAEPASVHGVIIADPEFAQILRKAGAFSGKGIRNAEALPDFLERLDQPDVSNEDKTLAIAYPISLSD